MAEENFSSAEEALEIALISSVPGSRHELISLYLEILVLQKKSLPDHFVIEVIHLLWNQNPDLAVNVYEHSSHAVRSSKDSRVLFFRMKLAEKRGHIQELHDLISSYQLHLYERNLPMVPEFVKESVNKYFRLDFQLRLQGLALTLLRKDLATAESQLTQMILEAHEKASPKILKEKLTAIHNVLVSQTEKGILEIYQSFLHILIHGFHDKKDFKRLAEAVIYFDDFRFDVMLMQVLVTHGYDDLGSDYAPEISAHKNYDFVYIAKHFPQLKKFFVSMTQPIPRSASWETPDLTLLEEPETALVLSQLPEKFADEGVLIHLVRNQEFSNESLLDLAVSFIQTELPGVALASAMVVHDRVEDKKVKLKAAYLALTALLQSGDYRRAVDLALESMNLVETTDDLLSFLYCEAEAYLRLGMKKEARQILNKILSIDSTYRMARERLERLE